MEPSHVFYKELPLDESNIFFANLAENNEIKKYAISGLSINQDTTSYVSLPNIEGQEALCDILRTYSEEKTSLTSS